MLLIKAVHAAMAGAAKLTEQTVLAYLACILSQSALRLVLAARCASSTALYCSKWPF